MATRKKKKQRTMQLMASAALLSTTVAPYVISAEELTVGQAGNTNEALQNSGSNTTQTTGDSANISPAIENTIDNGSEITSSGGNTTTESIGNGTVNSTTLLSEEAIVPANLVAPTTVQSVPTFIETHDITLNFKNEKQDDKSVMDTYVNDTAVLGITADGKKYIQMTIPASYKGWITGFKSTVGGQLQDSISEAKEDGTTVYTFQIDSFDNSAAWVKVDIDAINYHHDYIVFLNFPNIENEYTEPVTPTPPVFTAKHVEKNVNFQFTTGADFETGAPADSYLKAFVTQADLVIGEDGKPYADITFGGHSYAGTAIKVGAADGSDAEIIASTGSAETKDWVRTVRVALNEDYRADIFFGSDRGNYTFKFDLVEEKTKFSFTSGTANDAYFSAWVPRADLVETATNEKYVYITFAGHSYAVGAITVNGLAADIVSSTGSAETKDLTRVVRVKLDTSNKAGVALDGGTHGAYTFTFDFTKQVETPFTNTLTEDFQAIDFDITAGMPAMFIVPGIIEAAQAKKVAGGIAFSIQTTKAESTRGYYKTFIIKQDGNIVKEVSSETNEIAEFTVPSLDALTIDVVYVAGGAETTYTGTVVGAKLIVVEPEQTTPDTSAVNPGDYTTGSDLDEAIFTEQSKKVQFIFKSLVNGIPSAAALATIVPEAIVTKEGEKYEVTLQVNPVRTDRLFVAQQGKEIASVDTPNQEATTLTFTVDNLDHLFFYVDGVSGAATGSIETVIGAEVTGYEVIDATEQPTTPETGSIELPTPDEVVNADADFTFSTGEEMIDSYMGSYIKNAKIVRIGTKLYADIELTGNTYAYTSIKLGSKNGADAAYASNGLTGKDLVRTIRVPLDANKKSVVAMFGGNYDNTFTFDFAPVAKSLVNTAADLTAQDQAIAFAYSSATSWHAAAFPSTIKAAAAKAVNGKVQVTLQVDTAGLNSFTATQNEQTIATWTGASSLVTFTVNSLEGLTFSSNKTAGGRTTDMTVNVDEVSLHANGALPTETVVIEPEQPVVTDPNTVPVFKATHSITLKFKNDTKNATSVMDEYVNDSAVLGITADGKKYIQMTVPPSYKGWITGFKSTVGGQLKEAIKEEKANGTTVYTFPIDTLTSTAAWVKVDIDSINYHHDYTVYLDFPNINNEYAEQPVPGENGGTTPTQPENPVITPPVVNEGTAITYTMKADPNGEMADFITGYLNPYFSNAKLITKDSKKFVQLTLKGKAYGFAKLQYIDKNGAKQNVTTISSTGEKLDQVRVVELPLIQDANGVSKVFVDSGDLGYGAYTLFFTFNVNSIAAPSKESSTSNAIIKKPDDLKLEKNKEATIIFNFGTSDQPEVKKVLDALKEMIAEPKIKVTSNNLLAVTFKITPKSGVKKLRVMKNGQQLGIWEAPSTTARIASLLPFFASNSNEISFETDSLEGITFEAVDTNDKVVEAAPTVEIDKALANTNTPTNPGTVTGGGTGGGSVVTPPATSDVENRESINYKMVSDPNGPMADFMTNYMTPYFSNAELVTVSGKNYIELTLTGKAYGFQNLRVTGGYKVISSEGEKMDQVRVIRFPAAKDVTIHVDSGELSYGAYDLLFTFELSEEQLKNAAAQGTGGITAVQTITPQIVSEGDVKFTIPAEASAIVTYAKKISAKLVDGKYNVDVTLMTETDLETFVVKQGEKEITRWDKKNKSASLTNVAATNVLSFTVETLDNLTFTATTKNRTLEAKVGAELLKQEVVQEASKDDRQAMAYTMTADPNGPMADFISNYLAPYFSNAVYVTESGKEFVELTLTGKAYGFAKLQYIDADGKYVDIDVLSSTGEKLDQVRVVRLPLVKDKDDITKIFVDSGDLGYGAYTLFFKFNVPAKSGNPVATTITNPFKDIDSVYSKDDILALHAAGITTGTTENTFSPNASMTRAQFAVMVARALGVSSTTETKFKDVQGKWYAAEVQALAEIGIITGVSDTKFKPGDKITRQQAAVMIHRMLKYKGYTNKTTADALNFKDNVKVADYAKEALAELQAQGIMTGSDGKVNPKANLTRAQMAKILKNAADLVGLLY